MPTSRVRFTAPVGLLWVVWSAFLYGCRPEPPPVENVFVLRAQGLDHLERGELLEAEEQFKKLVSLAPREPVGYANLGLTYLRAGRYADAELQLRRALRLDPENPELGLTVARLYALTGRETEARAALERLLRDSPGDPRVLYALAELDAEDPDTAAQRRREDRLRQIVTLAPANLAVRLMLTEALLRRGEADSVVRHLEELRRVPPELPREARAQLERSIQLLRTGEQAEATAPFERFLRIMELTPPYQSSFNSVKWLEGPLPGRPIFAYSPSLLVALRAQGVMPSGVVRFVDATAEAGLPGAPTTPAAAQPAGELPSAAVAVEDFDGSGWDDLFVSFGPPGQRKSQLYSGTGGYFLDVTEQFGVSLPAGAADALFADFDNNGHFDLLAIGADGRVHLFRNEQSGNLADVTAQAGLRGVRGARRGLFVDLDHDGDLDLLLLGSDRLQVFRNNLDGTFTETTAVAGLASAGSPRAVGVADFDDDGRIDLFIANQRGGDLLFRNTGAGRFSDVTAQSGITSAGSGVMAVGDYDNDGWFDIFVASAAGGPPALWRNNGYGTFSRDGRSAATLEALRATAAQDAGFVDYDNDGWLDLVVVGRSLAEGTPSGGILVFHNEGEGVYRNRSEIVPRAERSGSWSVLAASDIDSDGDQDLLVAGAGGIRLLRNQGGNNRLAMQVRLLALRDGSGKNNVFGIGARLELRAGEIYQTRVVTRRVTHLGLGSHLKGDVLRVQWPNGVLQTVYLPGTDQDVLEAELLKGSCPFLYTWDGKGFRFVTDVMWRSALGMPLGILGLDGVTGGEMVWAPADASREYVRIPGDLLRPRGRRYVIQLTEELWETAYVDEVRLLAVDHPDSVQVFVDERFVPPGPQQLRLFRVVRPRPPLSAIDGRGEDVLPALLEHDYVYVSGLTPLRYQGLVEPHELVLDLGPDAGSAGTYLFLRGWIYPTDASINVALSQQWRLRVQPPSLEVRGAQGGWTTAIPNLSFPAGKDKTMVIDLEGKFPTDDRRVRIRTNLQIYWDQALVAREAPQSPVRVTTLMPLRADLHFRGFSRMYRRGGRYGPHWFDYDDVTQESFWRPIEGAFTRFGDVLPLLSSADDRYVVMGPGDELTVEFDAASERTLPPGWKRTFLLYTVSWVKDSDLNTAFGNTVEPLPFHGMKAYPYRAGDSYPGDSTHQRYLREYNTRVVKRR